MKVTIRSQVSLFFLRGLRYAAQAVAARECSTWIPGDLTRDQSQGTTASSPSMQRDEQTSVCTRVAHP